MPERVILTIGTKKGLFVAQAAKALRSFALNGPVGSGVAVVSLSVAVVSFLSLSAVFDFVLESFGPAYAVIVNRLPRTTVIRMRFFIAAA